MSNTPSRTATLPEKDAAPYVGYTPAAFRAWRREGRGPAYIRVGRSIRYLQRDLDAWLSTHRVETADSRMEAR
jgi:predicted DNA-binding transcriptional regulator AlpA